MGLISFVKNAGAKIFGGSEAKPAPAEQLHKELEKHGLDASNVKITVDGDKVKVSGTAATTEQAEKIAIALGNTVGVQTVENDIKAAKAEAEFEVLYGEERRHAVGYRRERVRQGARRQIRRHLPGQPADADPSGQDLPRPGAARPPDGVAPGFSLPRRSARKGRASPGSRFKCRRNWQAADSARDAI